MEKVSVTIIGAGVIGLAIAQKISKMYPDVLVLEQNTAFGRGISSRHSEIIHAGIYYPENSLKAKLCIEGKNALYDYCKRYSIQYRRIGKVIVATSSEEEPILEKILRQAQTNGVDDLQEWSAQMLSTKEPNVTATGALFSPSTGILDSHSLMRSFLGKAEKQGGSLALKAKTTHIEVVKDGFLINVTGLEDFCFRSSILINAAGLNAQKMSKSIQGLDSKTIPPLYLCKGNYFSMGGKSPFSHLIYPIPEKSGAGLGIHATLDLGGQVRFGPDTEYIDHEDYQVNVKNLPKFRDSIRRYYPKLKTDDLQPAYTGIRPKLHAPDESFRDFVIQDESEHQIPGLIQLFGIESPGLTASLAIANHVDRLLKQ